MPLRPPGKLPRSFARRFGSKTHSLVERRYRRHRDLRREQVRRSWRRVQHIAGHWRRAATRWILLLLLGLVLVLAGLLLFSPIVRVREIRVVRLDHRLDVDRVQHTLSPLFGTHLLFVTDGEVERLLQDELEDLDQVTVRKLYPSRLVVQIRLKPLVARLLIADPEGGEVREASGSTVLDALTEDGVYVQSVGEDGQDLPVIKLVDWAVRPEPGSRLIPSDLLTMLAAMQQALHTQFGQSIGARTIYLRAQEFHIQADGISLWFDTKSSVDEHLRRYRIFLQNVPRTEVTKYVDLRLRDKIVYR